MSFIFPRLQSDYQESPVYFVMHDFTHDRTVNDQRMVPELQVSFIELHRWLGLIDEKGGRLPGLSTYLVADAETYEVLGEYHYPDQEIYEKITLLISSELGG